MEGEAIVSYSYPCAFREGFLEMETSELNPKTGTGTFSHDTMQLVAPKRIVRGSHGTEDSVQWVLTSSFLQVGISQSLHSLGAEGFSLRGLPAPETRAGL